MIIFSCKTCCAKLRNMKKLAVIRKAIKPKKISMVKPFKLDAKVKKADGSVIPFSVSISKPQDENGEAFVCLLDCPLPGLQRHKVFGAYADQSMALALWLVEDQLKHHGYVLVDDKGKHLQLPIDPNATLPGQAGASPIAE